MLRASRAGLAGTMVMALMLLGGCAAAGTATGGGGATGAITAEDLAGLQNMDLLLAVRRTRPNWLRYRGGTPLVILDGIRMGGVDSLRQILTQDVSRVEFLTPQEASNRYGTGFPNGAIEIASR